MFSYYGIAASFTLSFLNYLILGWELPVDGYYLHAFEIWLAVTVVFTGAGTLCTFFYLDYYKHAHPHVAMTVVEYRLGLRSLFKALWINVKWIPFFLCVHPSFDAFTFNPSPPSAFSLVDSVYPCPAPYLPICSRTT
jgi:hypothetical protein